MSAWTFYRLDPKPGAGFHLGLRGLEGEVSAAYCPSDTLFAALVATLAGLGGDRAVREFVAPFQAGQPPFLLSSAFPCAGHLPLLPLPRLKVELTPQPGRRKLLKRMRYVSPALLRAILAGDKLDAYADEGDASRGRFVQDGQVWLGADEVERLPQDWQDLTPATLRAQKVWHCDAVDRVAIDRASSASAVYRAGRTTYAPGCGLWLGVQWPGGMDADAKAQLETLLAHLGDQGLGGDRSVGYGQFRLKKDAFSLDLPAPDGARALTLARYLPHPDELPDVLGPGASYGLVNVVGWLGSPQGAARRRKGLRMLAESSVLPTAARPAPWGRLADVAPDDWHAHPVWRYGYACPVGVRAPVDAPDSDASPEVAHA